jgi:circadian clock protein KaiC
LFITFEENKEEFYVNMKEFGWDLEKYEKNGQFHFLEYNPEKVNSMIEQGGGEIEDIVVNNKISRIVVDSITSFALLFEDELQKREAALSLFNIIRKWGATSLLTLQENPLRRDPEKSSELEFESDSIILIYFVRVGKQRKRFIEILKMRGTKHATEIHELNLKEKIGIEVTKKIHTNGFSNP